MASSTAGGGGTGSSRGPALAQALGLTGAELERLMQVAAASVSVGTAAVVLSRRRPDGSDDNAGAAAGDVTPRLTADETADETAEGSGEKSSPSADSAS